ncbi:hypothetical protein IAU59_004114 [Kwoniella sp. CBS 9459]
MSNSSLLQSAPSSDTLELHPPRPVPRRTYGRARPASPPPPEALSSSLATSAHSGELIDRWSKSNQGYNDLMSNLDAASSDKADEVDEEEVLREMERMRRQRREMATMSSGPPSSQANDGQSVRAAEMGRDSLAPPKPRLGISFSSSSLTSIPTAQSSSPLRSSPPARSPSPRPAGHAPLQAQSSELAEETMHPVRKSGLSGKPKRIVMSDDDEDEDEDDQPLFANDASRSPSMDHVSTTEKGSSPSPYREPSPSSQQKGDDEEEKRQDISDYINELNVEEEQEEARKVTENVPGSSALDGLDDLFEEEDNETPQAEAKKKGRVSRGLNKHDRDLVNKDMARAAREKPVYVSRPSPERMPISTWLQNATMAVKTAEPKPRVTERPGQLRLQERRTSASPSQPMIADEISAFTPSSAPREPLTGNSKPSVVTVHSSPTPITRKGKGKSKVVVPGTSDAPEEDEVESQDISSFLASENKRDAEEAARQEKLKRLQELKQMHARAPPAKLHLGPAKPGSDDELEFEEEEVTPKKEVKPIVKVAKGGRGGGGAKGVLMKDSAQPTVSRQKQLALQRAGKSGRSRHSEEITETYMDAAGKAFRHSDQKQLNAGARPVGQKHGRDTALTPQAVEAYMKQSHQRQVAAIQKKKEEDYGRARRLPQRVEQDIEIVVEASKAEADAPSDGDDDGDDGDYAPDDEGEEEDDRMAWSGEEAEDGSDEDGEEENGVLDVGEDVAKENKPAPTVPSLEEDDDEVIPSFKRKPRISRRAIDSDDEESVPQPQTRSSPAQRTPLKDIPTPQVQASAKDNQSDIGFGDIGFGDIDFGGFGSGDGGSQGFSQLFGATQAGDDGADHDAFAALRAQEPVGLLPVNAALPSVEISKTQIDRDNALIAGEIEDAAMDRMHEAEAPKKQYINERGLFTQTKPATLQASATQLSDDEDSQSPENRRQLAGASSLSLANGFDSTPFGKTQSQTQAASTMVDAQDSLPTGSPSPTQTQEESFSRLRRRRSDPEGASITLSPTQPANAFERLMAGPREPIGQNKKLKSKMVDEQAEESDEDNGWGRMGDEDEDDDEGDDGYVEGLVDDQAIDEEEKRRQDEAAAEKNREIQMADDARREAEARKITEGEHRRKKRGVDFYSDDDDDDDDGKKKRWSKKQRRKRKLEAEDGLVKLDGEENVFVKAYDEDLDSDDEDIEETPLSPGLEKQRRVYHDIAVDDDEDSQMEDPPRQPAMTYREKMEMVKKRAELNRGKTTAEIEAEDAIDLDDIATGPAYAVSRKRRNTFVDEPEEMGIDADDAGHSGFSISRSASRSMSNLVAARDDDEEHTSNTRPLTKSSRRLESYATYVQEESQVNRRAAGGASGVSVVRQASNGGGGGDSFGSGNGRMGPPGAGGRPPPVPHPHRQSTASSSSSGSILMSKNSGFA